jgi:hypothetical protein
MEERIPGGNGEVVAETEQIVKYVAQVTGVPLQLATNFITVAHEIVEELITDDVVVVAPPLMVGRVGCPVLDRLLMLMEDPHWTLPESLDVSNDDLAAALRLPPEVLEAYPVVGRFGLLAKCLDRRAVPDDQAETHLRMLDAWLATYADLGSGPRPFEVLPTGSKEAFRGWLLDRLDLLGRYGYPVSLTDPFDDTIDSKTHVFADGRRPDLVVKVSDDGDVIRKGDWLVISHKVTAVGHTAGDELALHVDWLRAELGTNDVHGLLIADGASLLVERGLRERGFGYLSLSSLGYRKWIRSHTRVTVHGDPDATAIGYPSTIRAGALTALAG